MTKAIIGLTLTILCLLLLISGINITLTVLELEPVNHGTTIAKFFALILLVIINSLLFGAMLVNIYGIYIAYRSSRSRKDINNLFKSIIEGLKKEDIARPSNYDFRRNPEGRTGNENSQHRGSIFDNFMKFEKAEDGNVTRSNMEKSLTKDEAFEKPIDSVLDKESDNRNGKEL